MSFYVGLDLLSISIPLVVSFHPRIRLHHQWQYLLPAILLSMIPYIIWDVYFTRQGYWGFNEAYLSGIYFLDLPLGEWLFFVCIPYACVFTHYALLALSHRFLLAKHLARWLTYGLLSLFLLLALLFHDRAYTLVDMAFAFAVLGLAHRFAPALLRSYFLTFLVMLIPFFIVNGILTGTGITDQVVWYNDAENLGIRLGTIPVEDVAYAFSLILLNLLLFETFKSRAKAPPSRR